MLKRGSMISPVFFDSCAFDGGDIGEQRASIEIRDLFDVHDGEFIILHSVQKELNFQKTPCWVVKLANTYVGTLEVSLTPDEQAVLSDVEGIIVGNGILENHQSDCRHVFEAQKHGRYFVTTDNGILKRSKALERRLTTLFVVRPTEFLQMARDNVFS